nr:unnamed protein product [Digitaria exilis]
MDHGKGDSEAPPCYLEIAGRRREARGRDAAASSGDRDAAWWESLAERFDGELERSAARARRAPPAAAAIGDVGDGEDAAAETRALI